MLLPHLHVQGLQVCHITKCKFATSQIASLSHHKSQVCHITNRKSVTSQIASLSRRKSQVCHIANRKSVTSYIASLTHHKSQVCHITNRKSVTSQKTSSPFDFKVTSSFINPSHHSPKKAHSVGTQRRHSVFASMPICKKVSVCKQMSIICRKAHSLSTQSLR